MSVGDIIKILDYKGGKELYKVTCKMLEDGGSGAKDICASGEDTDKAKGICDWLEEKSGRKVTANQSYALKMFIACNLGLYGKTYDHDSVNNVFNSLL